MTFGPDFVWRNCGATIAVTDCYRFLQDQKIELLELVYLSEILNGCAPLPLKKTKDKFLGLSREEYELLPKPTIAIKKYLHYLCDLGFLKYLYGYEFEILYREETPPYG